MNRKKLPLSVKSGYGIGDLVAGLAFQTINFHYLFFLNAIVGLPGHLAGLVILIGKGWDGISDPLMGMLVDNTTSKKGKHRFWLLVSIVPFVISFILLWTTFGGSVFQRFMIYAILFLLFSTVFTAYNIPYGSMTADLTEDYNERTTLTGVRMVFTLLSMIIGAGATEIIIALFSTKTNPKSPAGYLGMTLVFGSLMLIAGLVAYVSTKRYDTVLEKSKGIYFKTYIDTFRNRPFVVLLCSYFFLTIATTGVSSIFVYYVNYCLDLHGFASSIIMGVLVISSISALPLWAIVSSRLSKKTALVAGMAIFVAGLAIITSTGLSAGKALFYMLIVITGAGLSSFFIVLWSMIPDVVEYGELLHKQRNEGVYYGIWFFVQKLGMAIAFQVNGLVLSLSGFREGGGSTMATQASSALGGIKTLISIIPAVFIVIGIGALLFYPINAKFHADIRKQLGR
jgi:GPH family glycoside/pentoside/hexuronide:cation symporter